MIFQEMVGGVQVRLNTWSQRFLTYGGRIVLLRHVLSSFHIHLLTVLSLPLGILRQVESIFAQFLWGHGDFGKKFHWRSWSSLCYIPPMRGRLV